MKKIVPLLGLALLAACSQQESSETTEIIRLENPTFTTDTIAVSIGDEIFNASGYYGFDMSQDGSKAYLFNNQEFEIHEINLTAMTLVARHPFEKDGPNRFPGFVNYFQALPDEEFLLANSNSMGVYSITAELVQKLNISTESVSGFDMEKSGYLSNNPLLTLDKRKAITLPRAFMGAVSGLGLIDLETMTGRNIELPAMKITDKYRVTFSEGGGSTSYGEFEETQEINGKFLVISGATSDIYQYDPETDSLRLISFPHQLVSKTKTGDFPTNVDSRERMLEVSREIGKQIDFGSFYWDEKNGRYLRFAQINKYDVEGKMSGADFYVFIYSEDFKLQAEGELKGMSPLNHISFVKDGKLYSYITVDENPGFVAYDFDF